MGRVLNLLLISRALGVSRVSLLFSLWGAGRGERSWERGCSEAGRLYTGYQDGERLGGETSGSERKGVMQWTGSELKSETQTKTVCSKVRGFGGTERGIFYPCIVVVYNLKMFWSR